MLRPLLEHAAPSHGLLKVDRSVPKFTLSPDLPLLLVPLTPNPTLEAKIRIWTCHLLAVQPGLVSASVSLSVIRMSQIYFTQAL